RPSADSPPTDMDLDKRPHRQASCLHRAMDWQGLVDVVQANNRVGLAPQGHEPLDFPRPGDWVGNQELMDSAGGEHLRLAELGARQTDRSGVDEPAADVGRFAALGMRPPGDSAAAAEGYGVANVGLERRQVQAEGRRIEAVFRSAQGWEVHPPTGFQIWDF